MQLLLVIMEYQVKKKEKFDGSQSSTTVENLNEKYPYDTDILILSIFQITMKASFLASDNDSYQNNTLSQAFGLYLHTQREYIINPIDERSNIYGHYSDRYKEFINDKRIFDKYKEYYNPNNKNLLLKDD